MEGLLSDTNPRISHSQTHLPPGVIFGITGFPSSTNQHHQVLSNNNKQISYQMSPSNAIPFQFVL